MRGARARRGASLVEALVAVAVLGVGTAAVTNLMSSISAARRKMAFQTTSLELFNRLNSEIQASTCLVFPGQLVPDLTSADPAFLVPVGTWRDTPVGAHVRTIGNFTNVVPQLRVEYQIPVAPAALAAGPLTNNQAVAFDIVVRIREITHDAAQDAADVMSTHYIRSWPTRKTCMSRLTADTRGGFL